MKLPLLKSVIKIMTENFVNCFLRFQNLETVGQSRSSSLMREGLKILTISFFNQKIKYDKNSKKKLNTCARDMG